MFPYKLQQRRGFTLVEILTVVVILGIASAIIIPQLGSRSDLIASSASRTLMADLIYAQNRAISLQKPHYVEFNGQTYTISTRDATGSPLYTITNPVTLDPYVVTFNATGTPLADAQIASFDFAGKTMMGFDELGSPFSYDKASDTATSMTGSGTVTISSGAINLSVQVEPYTGELTVQ
jgi:type II secretion system protein H